MADTAVIATDAPPRENLVRAMDFEIREGDGEGRVMAGHFAVFDQWTEINSRYEGRFLERFTKGAFAKTFSENRDGMRVLFQHGADPQIGDKVLGPIRTLEEQDRGAYYEVPLLDTSYNRDLIPGLQAGLYGASFRFRVVKEEFVNKPERSDYNPDGLPERTVSEAKVMEFGPVTFPAYAGASAGVRSLTDDFLRQQLGDEPPVEEIAARKLGETEPEPSGDTTPPTEEPEPPAAATPTVHRFQTTEEWDQWISLQTWMG